MAEQVKPSKHELASLYWGDKQMTCAQIAPMFGVSGWHVHEWLKTYEIPRRDPGRPRKLPGKDILFELYVTKRMSTVEIAKKYKMSDPRGVGMALKKYGITLRRSGPVRTAKCSVAGCTRPLVFTLHKKMGSWYGKRCEHHRALHYAKLNRNIKRRTRKIPQNKWRYVDEIPNKRLRAAIQEEEKEQQCLKQVRQLLIAMKRRLKSPAPCPSPNAE